MTDLKKMMAARQNVLSAKAAPQISDKDNDYDDYIPTQDDHDEALGLALAARMLAAEYGDDPTSHEFHKHLDALHGDGNDEGRSYAAALPAPKPGMQLVASKKNPKVRRWIRTTAMKNVMHGAVTTGAKGAGIAAGIAVGKLGGGVRGGQAGATAAGLAVIGIHNAVRRQSHLSNDHDSAMSSMHYLKNHEKFINAQAKKLGVRTATVAHALAYQAHVEHHRQVEEVASGSKMGNGHPHPLANKNLTDAEYHKNLAGRAKHAFTRNIKELVGS